MVTKMRGDSLRILQTDLHPQRNTEGAGSDAALKTAALRLNLVLHDGATEARYEPTRKTFLTHAEILLNTCA